MKKLLILSLLCVTVGAFAGGTAGTVRVEVVGRNLNAMHESITGDEQYRRAIAARDAKYGKSGSATKYDPNAAIAAFDRQYAEKKKQQG
ncbi:MAG: hypothetical protein WD055_00540 [Candidatus Dependentiae bacterium]